MMQRNLKLWRESASLILITKNFTASEKWNYKILAIKRSKTMKFMPNVHTFPGGVLEESDAVNKWLELYQSFGIKNEQFDKLKKGNRGSIFKNYSDSELSRDISLRISAIRETFEECGILIAKHASTNSKKDNSYWASCIGAKVFEKWQNIVQNDSMKFLDMCYEHNIYPDIFNLYEWSNWLTPFTMPQQFNTIFFIAALANKPQTSAESNEIEYMEWKNPYDYLKMNHEKSILLSPPQFYELSRLASFHDINSILNYAQLLQGCEFIVPYRISVSGKTVTILPGDGLYPTDDKIQEKKMSSVEKLPDCEIIRRIIHPSNLQNQLLLSNFHSKYALPYIYQPNIDENNL